MMDYLDNFIGKKRRIRLVPKNLKTPKKRFIVSLVPVNFLKGIQTICKFIY